MGARRDDAKARPRWRAGMIIGAKFALTRQLEERAVSTVFEARHVGLGRRVVIEVLAPKIADDADALARLQREAAAASSIEHPNVVAIFDVAKDAITGAHFLARAWLDGQRLRARMNEKGRFSVEASLDVVVPIMAALEALHRLHVVHGAVSPESIFLASTATGTAPTLVDFGFASRAAEEGAFARRYLAPEQLRGEPVDARADVFAVGVVLFELLTGRVPHEADAQETLLGQAASASPARAETYAKLPAGMRALVSRALEPDRKRRFASMAEMLRAALASSVDGSGLGAALAARHRASLGDLVERPHAIWSAPRQTPLELAVVTAQGASANGEAALSLDELQRLRTSPGLPTSVDFAPPHDPEGEGEIALADAYASLQRNALDEAWSRAEGALAGAKEPSIAAALRLVQATVRAVAGRWSDADALARAASAGLDPASPRAITALGLRAEIAGALGGDDLARVSAGLMELHDGSRSSIEYLVAACRLAIQLLHAGQVTPAERWRDDAHARARLHAASPLASAWLEHADAELALHQGDLVGALDRQRAAIERFEDAGDARDACRALARVGHLLVDLGAFAEAAAVLRDALASAEAMKLPLVPALHADLGRARLRLGEPDARDALDRAIAEAAAMGDHGSEALARAYLARALCDADADAADREARRAIEASGAMPSSRAFALAVLAQLALTRRHPKEALAFAGEAYQLLARLRGVESGQMFIRLQFAAALDANGRAIEAGAVLDAARDRLVAAASRIADPRARASFLEAVPENAATLERVRRAHGSEPAR